MDAHWLDRLIVNPAIQHGKPCVRGTRTPVYVVLEALAHGLTIEEVIQEYPPLTEADIHACLEYAALLADEQDILPQVVPPAA